MDLERGCCVNDCDSVEVKLSVWVKPVSEMVVDPSCCVKVSVTVSLSDAVGSGEKDFVPDSSNVGELVRVCRSDIVGVPSDSVSVAESGYVKERAV